MEVRNARNLALFHVDAAPTGGRGFGVVAVTLAALLPALAAALALFFGLRGRPPGLRLGAALFLGAAAAALARSLPHEVLRWGFVLAFALLARVLYPYSRRTDAPPAYGLDLPRTLWLFGTVLLLVLASRVVYG